MHSLIIFIAKDFIVIPPLILAWVLFKSARQDTRRAVVIIVLATVLTAVLAFIGSELFNDPRPFIAGHFTPYFAHGNDNGFPSDHTLLAGLIAALTYVYSKRWGLVLFIVAALIGTSRVIAGVHHVADIIGALVFACIATFIAELIASRYLTKE